MVQLTHLETALALYTIVKPCGEGGSGRVYKVRDDAGEFFAAKVLNPATATRSKRRRFKNEMAFAERNTHPNVITVYDRGVVQINGESAPFFIMPYFEASLRKLLHDGMPASGVLAIFMQMLDGVEAAHLQSVIHRDLKPENILCDIAAKQIVVADFGIADFTADLLLTLVETKPNERLANFEYAAPEQRRRGGAVDARADIYALGLILHEMFIGEVPHGTHCSRIADVSAPHGYLDEIVDQMRSQDPAKRQPSISVIKQQLATRGRIAATEQKLSILKNTVVPASSVDDPLVVDPIRLERIEFLDDRLFFVFQKPATPRWFSLFQRVDYGTAPAGKTPSRYQFHSNAVSIDVSDEREAEKIIKFFSPWIPSTNENYRREVEREYEVRQEVRRAALKNELAQEERRRRILSVIKPAG